MAAMGGDSFPHFDIADKLPFVRGETLDAKVELCTDNGTKGIFSINPGTDIINIVADMTDVFRGTAKGEYWAATQAPWMSSPGR